MDNRVVHVPVSRLLDSSLTATAKVVWIGSRLHPTDDKDLQAFTGLTRRAVRRGLSQLPAGNRTPGGPKVKVPAALLALPSVDAQAKVLYGLLQTTPHFNAPKGQFTYPSLRALTQLGPNTLKRAIGNLEGSGWIQISQFNRVSPIQFILGSPELRRSQAEADQADRRIKWNRSRGEGIMQEYLSLLIASDHFTDNARPGFLVNPLTNERLELDRFYLSNVAFEFNGDQHYIASEKFTQAEVDAQRKRDLIKAGICLYCGIQLVIIHAEDLSVRGMVKKIGQLMPLRNLAGHEPLIDMLENSSMAYRATAAAGR